MLVVTASLWEYLDFYKVEKEADNCDYKHLFSQNLTRWVSDPVNSFDDQPEGNGNQKQYAQKSGNYLGALPAEVIFIGGLSSGEP